MHDALNCFRLQVSVAVLVYVGLRYPLSFKVPQMSEKFQIIQTTWAQHSEALKKIRQEVFVEEQEVEPAFEWDDIDPFAVHVLVTQQGEPIGCARVINYQKIGRMAVTKPWRGHGVGRAILDKAINICQEQGSTTIKLTAQTHAITFYKQAGFKETSGVYQDANIPHVDMQLDLS